MCFDCRYLMGDLLNEINFNEFEEEFKIPQKNRKGSDSTKDSVDGKGKVRGKEENGPAKAKLTSLLEHTRLRNIAICTRKLPSMPIPDLIKAINSLDIEVSTKIIAIYIFIVSLNFIFAVTCSNVANWT